MLALLPSGENIKYIGIGLISRDLRWISAPLN
jgi:hypothetical protein